MIPRDIFTHYIIKYFRGNYSEINNIIVPLSTKNYQEYNRILETMKKTCCFIGWYNKFYDENVNKILSINKCLLFYDVDYNYLETFYLDNIGIKYCICYLVSLRGRIFRSRSHRFICPKLAIINKMLEIENSRFNSFMYELKKEDARRINLIKNKEKYRYDKYSKYKYNKHEKLEKRYKNIKKFVKFSMS